jgi:hypothetical protein
MQVKILKEYTKDDSLFLVNKNGNTRGIVTGTYSELAESRRKMEIAAPEQGPFKIIRRYTEVKKCEIVLD